MIRSINFSKYSALLPKIMIVVAIALATDAFSSQAAKSPKSVSSDLPMRLGIKGGLTLGLKDTPDAGIYTYGGVFAWRINNFLGLLTEPELSITKFDYQLSYSDADVLLDVSTTSYAADATLLAELIPKVNLKARAGVGVNFFTTSMTNSVTNEMVINKQTKGYYSINLGAGIEKRFNDFYGSLEVLHPIFLEEINRLGSINLQLCMHAGLLF